MAKSEEPRAERRYAVDPLTPPSDAERIKARIVEPSVETMEWARAVAAELQKGSH